MPRPRFAKAEPEKREALLRAAAAEFAKSGYEAASLNRILEAAGLTKGSFYYWFDDKADLAATVLERAMKVPYDFVGAIELPSSVNGFWRVMDEMARRSLEMLRDSSQEMDLIVKLGTAAIHDPVFRERIGPLFDLGRDAMEPLIRRGQEMGAVRIDLEPRVLIAMVQAAKEALSRAILAPGTEASDAAIDRVGALTLDAVRRLLSPAPKKRRSSRA